MDSQILTKKLCFHCKTIKLTQEFNKQKSAKDGLQSYCKECARIKHKQWIKLNLEKLKKNLSKSYFNNIEKRKKTMKNYYEKNKNEIKQNVKEWGAKNRERCNQYIKNWANKNKARKNASVRLRQTLKLKATPVWADLEAIRVEYALAEWCTQVMGEPYHVDHIIPLRGKNVCGLHVHNNLQVIRAKENSSKSNKFHVS
jgi:hypothetical protein